MFTLKSSALALACAAPAPLFAQPRFKMTDLGTIPGTSSSWAVGINELGEVAGFSGARPEAFLFWSATPSFGRFATFAFRGFVRDGNGNFALFDGFPSSINGVGDVT